MMNLGGFAFNTSMISLIKSSTKALLRILSISRFSDKLHPTWPLPHLLPLSYWKTCSSDSVLLLGLIVEATWFSIPLFVAVGKKTALEHATKVLIMHVERHGKDNWILFHLYLTKIWGFICGLSVLQIISPHTSHTLKKHVSLEMMIHNRRGIPQKMCKRIKHQWEKTAPGYRGCTWRLDLEILEAFSNLHDSLIS